MSSTSEEIKLAALSDPVNLHAMLVDEYEQRILGGDNIITANNTFSFAIEMASRLTANVVSGISSELDHLYPTRANSTNDLFRHMSDFEYAGMWSSPASTEIVVLLDKDYIKANAETIQEGGAVYRKVIIPKDTMFSLGEYKFGLYYPIIILINDVNGSVTINWDISELNSLYSLSEGSLAYSIEHRTTSFQDVELLTFRIPVHQFEKTEYREDVTDDLGFIRVYPFNDKFYAIKVFYDADRDGIPDTEMHTTLSNKVYNPNTPTAWVTVDPESNKVRVVIPQIYFSKYLIGTRVRVEIYTSLGAINVQVNAFEEGLVTIQIPKAKVDLYSKLLSKMTFFTASIGAAQIVGGSNGYDFNELMERVVNNSFYDKVPVTTAELVNFFQDAGFFIKNYRDGITNRVYNCYKELVSGNGRVIGTGGFLTYLSPIFENLGRKFASAITVNDDTSVVIHPDVIYQYDKTIGRMTPFDMLNTVKLTYPTATERVAFFNSNLYAFCPFHLRVHTSSRYPVAYSYLLTQPNVDEVIFINENLSKDIRASVTSSSVACYPRGFYDLIEYPANAGVYRLTFSIRKDNVTIDEENTKSILALITTTTVGGDVIGKLVDVSTVDEFTVDLPTNFKLHSSDHIYISGLTNKSDSSEYMIPLNPVFSVIFIEENGKQGQWDSGNVITTEVSNLLAYLIGQWQQNEMSTVVFDGCTFLNQQNINVTLGRQLSEVDNPMEIDYTTAAMVRYTEPVYATYEYPVFETDANGALIWSDNSITDWEFPAGTPLYEFTIDQVNPNIVTVKSLFGSDINVFSIGMAVSNTYFQGINLSNNLPSKLFITHVADGQSEDEKILTLNAELTDANNAVSAYLQIGTHENDDAIFLVSNVAAEVDPPTITMGLAVHGDGSLFDATPKAEEMLDVTVADNDISVVLASDAGAVSSTQIEQGLIAIIEIESELAGAAGDQYTLSIQLAETAYTPISIDYDPVTFEFVISLATKLEIDVPASASVGSGDDGVVTLTATEPDSNDLTVEVVEGVTEDSELDVAIVDGDITVTLGMDSGSPASIVLGSGENGTLTILSKVAGVAGNSKKVRAETDIDPPGNLAVEGNSTSLTIWFATDAGGQPIAAECTVGAIATLINTHVTLSQHFLAVPSGDGSGTFTTYTESTNLTGGGENIAPDDSKNTATLVAGIINNTLTEVTAVASGSGNVALTTPEGPTQFSGGTDEIVGDDAINIASGVAAVIDDSNLLTASVVTGHDNDIIEVTTDPFVFSGGVDPVQVSTAAEIITKLNDTAGSSALIKAYGFDTGAGVPDLMEVTPLVYAAGEISGVTVGIPNLGLININTIHEIGEWMFSSSSHFDLTGTVKVVNGVKTFTVPLPTFTALVIYMNPDGTEKDLSKLCVSGKYIIDNVTYKLPIGLYATNMSVETDNGNTFYCIEFNEEDSWLNALSAEQEITFDAGIPILKHAVNDPLTLEQETVRSLQYYTNMIQVDAKYLMDQEVPSGTFLTDVCAMFDSYFTSIRSLSPSMLPATELFYLPQRTIGSTKITVGEGVEETITLELEPKFRLYVNSIVANDDTAKASIRDTIVRIINNHTANGRFSIAVIAKQINEALADTVEYVDIVGVRGINDADGAFNGKQTIINKDATVRPTLKTILKIVNGIITLDYGLTLEYIVV